MQGSTSRGALASGVTRLLALLLVLCLADCAAEQRVNRGRKPPTLGQIFNGHRSPRGGSCLSYGHSCWGGHGKRGGPTNLKLIEMMRRTVERGEQDALAGRGKSNDINPFYDDETDDVPNIQPFGNKFKNDNRVPLKLSMTRFPDAKPMLDDRAVSNMHLLNILRQYNSNEE